MYVASVRASHGRAPTSLFQPYSHRPIKALKAASQRESQALKLTATCAFGSVGPRDWGFDQGLQGSG